MTNTEKLQQDISAAWDKVYDGRVSRQKAQDAESKLVSAWMDELFSEYASDLPRAVQNMIYSKAYEIGHASGFSDIENYFSEFADFAREIRAAK